MQKNTSLNIAVVQHDTKTFRELAANAILSEVRI